MRGFKRAKRGAAMAYTVALIFVVAAFTGLILTVSAMSTHYADAYADYAERKLFLDEIGDLAAKKYAGDDTIVLTGYSGENNAFGFTVTDENGTVTVTGGAGTLLTIVYTETPEGGWTLTQYIYGAPISEATPEETP